MKFCSVCLTEKPITDYYAKQRACKVCNDAASLAHRQALRAQVLSLLGDRCVRCGYSDERALQIDHIHGGGGRHRRSRSISAYYREILRSVQNSEGRFQLLCANCNWIKRYENHELRRAKHAP